MDIAAQMGRVEVCRLLLDYGALVDSQQPHKVALKLAIIMSGQMESNTFCLAISTQKYWRTPLHTAAIAGHADLCRLLIERGAVVDARDEVR